LKFGRRLALEFYTRFSCDLVRKSCPARLQHFTCKRRRSHSTPPLAQRLRSPLWFAYTFRKLIQLVFWYTCIRIHININNKPQLIARSVYVSRRLNKYINGRILLYYALYTVPFYAINTQIILLSPSPSGLFHERKLQCSYTRA